VICSHSAGEVDTCERYLRELLTLLEPMYIGPNDKILRLKRLLANLLAARRPQLKEALQLHRESLALCEQMYGPHHLQVTTCTDDIGRCFFLMGDFEVCFLFLFFLLLLFPLLMCKKRYDRKRKNILQDL
jgi:hypothetical protein